MFSGEILAQKVPTLTYSDKFANESLKGKVLNIDGKWVATQTATKEIDIYLFLKKEADKTMLIRVTNAGDISDSKKPKRVKDVQYYYLSPELLQKLTIDTPLDAKKGMYILKSNANDIPFEQVNERKSEMLRWGFGDPKYIGTSFIDVGSFKNEKELEAFKKELFK